MTARQGEKVGWIGGWLGGFVWLLLLVGVWLYQQKTTEALVGLLLLVLGVAAVVFLAPWRHPQTRQWKLLLPIYIVLFLAVVWAVRAYGGLQAMGLNWWSVFWAMPLLIPFFTLGQRTWNEDRLTDAASGQENR